MYICMKLIADDQSSTRKPRRELRSNNEDASCLYRQIKTRDLNKIQIDGENVEHRAQQLQRKGTYHAMINPRA